MTINELVCNECTVGYGTISEEDLACFHSNKDLFCLMI